MVLLLELMKPPRSGCWSMFLCFVMLTNKFGASSALKRNLTRGVLSNEEVVLLFRETFLDLMTGLLEPENILLFTEWEKGQPSAIMDALEGHFPQNAFIIINKNDFQRNSDQRSILGDSYPSYFIRSSFAVAVLVIQNNPMALLDRLDFNKIWNPKHLVLWILDLNVNATQVIGHSVVQRSERIFMLRLVKKIDRFEFEASTSFPTKSTGDGRSLIFSPMGIWKPNLFTHRNKIFPSRYDSFGGMELELATWCDDTPFIYNINGTCKGAMLDAVNIIGRKYDFRPKPQLAPEDERWGSFENGSWVGMLRDLEVNGKHLIINDFGLNELRAKDFDFTYPYQAEGFAFLLRLPHPLPKWKSLLYPFAGYVWASTIFSTFLVSAVLSVLLSTFYGTKDPVAITLKVMSSVVRQSIGIPWASWSWTRIWLSGWWIAVIILSSTYTSNLIAVLTVPTYPKRIERLKELADSDIRPFVLDYGNLVPVSLRSSSDTTLATLGAKLEVAPYFLDVGYDSFFETLPEGHYALIETFYYLNNLQVLQGVMDISYIMKDQIFWGHLSWFLPKNTPYTSLISGALQRLREAGIVQKLFNDHTAHMRNQAMKTKLEQKERGGGVLLLSQLQGAFLLWLFGLALAAIVWILEMITPKIHQ